MYAITFTWEWFKNWKPSSSGIFLNSKHNSQIKYFSSRILVKLAELLYQSAYTCANPCSVYNCVVCTMYALKGGYYASHASLKYGGPLTQKLDCPIRHLTSLCTVVSHDLREMLHCMCYDNTKPRHWKITFVIEFRERGNVVNFVYPRETAMKPMKLQLLYLVAMQLSPCMCSWNGTNLTSTNNTLAAFTFHLKNVSNTWNVWGVSYVIYVHAGGRKYILACINYTSEQ